MGYLFIDTETTGLWHFKKSVGHPDQPRMAQLGAVLYNDVEEKIGSINLYVRPDGWEMNADAARIHGITQEKLDQEGFPLHEVLEQFVNYCQLADGGDGTGHVIAHNMDFDSRIISREMLLADIRISPFTNLRPFCTMKAMTPIMKLEGRWPGAYKWPKLIEAYRFMFGEGFEGQHDALADVEACARIYFMARKRGLFK